MVPVYFFMIFSELETIIITMKTNSLNNRFIGKAVKGFFVLCLAIFITSCDPCAEKVCDNGTCDAGTCVCDAGYVLNNDNCIGVNRLYTGTGTVNASRTFVDNLGNQSTLADIELTLTASTLNSYYFSIIRYENVIKNDITFTVSSAANGVLEVDLNVSNSAGNIYSLSGSKTGSRVTLILANSSGTTTLVYGA
jgi:hypothetical protein